MKHKLALFGLLILITALALTTARPAIAQCLFDRPLRAAMYSTTLVAAFPETNGVSGPASNTANVNGAPAYGAPFTTVQTFGQISPPLVPADGWRWNPLSTLGTLTVRTQTTSTSLPSQPQVRIHLTLANVLDATPGVNLANGSGLAKLRLTIRATQEDGGSDLTALDQVEDFPLTAIAGTVKFNPSPFATTIYRNSLGSPLALAVNACTSFEIRAVEILDADGKTFAVGGVHIPNLGPYLPTGGGPQCAFQHPTTATKVQFGLVQAFVECLPPGNPPGNLTTGGIIACEPPQTVYQLNGNPTTGWRWDVLKGVGAMQFKVQKHKGGANGLGMNGELIPANTGDVKITVKIKGVLDSVGPANGFGTVNTVWRFTLADRTSGDMTMVDFLINAPLALINGRAVLLTTVDTILNGFGFEDLPGCTTAQLVAVNISDSNGDTFAVPGLRTKAP